MTEPIDIKGVHNPAEKRFEVSLNGETALMKYQRPASPLSSSGHRGYTMGIICCCYGTQW